MNNCRAVYRCANVLMWRRKMTNFTLICFLFLILNASADETRGQDDLDYRKAVVVLKDSLYQLSHTPIGPFYKLGKVYSASYNLYSKSRHYAFVVDLVDEKTGAEKHCEVTILSRPWLVMGERVVFKCPGERDLVRRHDY